MCGLTTGNLLEEKRQSRNGIYKLLWSFEIWQSILCFATHTPEMAEKELSFLGTAKDLPNVSVGPQNAASWTGDVLSEVTWSPELPTSRAPAEKIGCF